jgi:hypothetical protein
MSLFSVSSTHSGTVCSDLVDKTEVVKEIDKWKRSMNQSSGIINTSELFEKKLKEKDSEIKKLSKKIDDLSSAHDVQCRKLLSDFNLKENNILKVALVSFISTRASSITFILFTKGCMSLFSVSSTHSRTVCSDLVCFVASLTVSLILDTSFGTVSRSCVFKCKSL